MHIRFCQIFVACIFDCRRLDKRDRCLDKTSVIFAFNVININVKGPTFRTTDSKGSFRAVSFVSLKSSSYKAMDSSDDSRSRDSNGLVLQFQDHIPSS